MVTGKATVSNQFGIHCRPSAVIAERAKEYAGSIRVRTSQGKASAKSVLELVGLAVACGEEVEIEVEGPDEAAVCREFAELFATVFDFKRD
jgi:phosphocarrier protein